MRIKFTFGIATLIGVSALLSCYASVAQVLTDKTELSKAAITFRERDNAGYNRALQLAAKNHWPLTIKGKKGKYGVLSGVSPLGLPVYKVVFNLTSAQTVGTTSLWPGGNTGLNLSGNSANMKGKLAIWDGGAVRGTHVELAGRVIQKDSAVTLDDHATHTSGTLIATGVNPNAKGMAFQAQELDAYDYNNDLAEMTVAAPGLYISSHSYGNIAGWNLNTDNNEWDWYGYPGDTVDYNFGFYDSNAQGVDSIAYHAPYYQIVFAAGNSRGETGPAVDSPYYGFNTAGNLVSQGARPADLSSNASFKTIPDYGNAKNIITVGAVNPIPNGYTGPGDVVMSYFSSWGPTTDGRIKPDVVADGVGVFSSVATSDYSYDTYDGTSMATPNTAGSLFLLQEYYSNKAHKDSAMRAATLKALVIHTADEAGTSPGPDFIYGWGLLDIKKAAGLITSSITDSTQQILEKTLVNSSADTFSIPVIASGKGSLLATIAWTDPPGTVNAVPSDRFGTEKKLINDLDLRIIKGSSVYEPWVLNAATPSAAATKGDNSLDNVEKVELDSVVPGATYTIRVTHKATLARGQQAFSLILSGVGGKGYCLSYPTSSAGTKVDSVSFSNIQHANAAGCTTYTDLTAFTASLQGNQSVPLYVSLGSCDNTNASRVVKVYIDYNNNGTFTDPGELVATSAVLTGSTAFSTTFTTPSGIAVGTSTRMRIVAEETTDTASVTPCGTYGKGETQDYTVQFVQPTKDLSIAALEDPLSPTCADSTQIVTVSIHNNGTLTQKGFPVTATVLSGGATITTISATYPDTIGAGNSVDFTLPGNFMSVAGKTYTINAAVSLPGDQDTANDHASYSITISNAASAPAGQGTVCGSGTAILTVTNADSANTYLWYTSATGGVPVAEGYNTTTTTIPSGNTYYLSSGGSTTIGPATNSVLGAGGYNIFDGNFVRYQASVPVTLESARLYTAYHGTVAFTVADIDTTTITANGSYSYIPITTTTIHVFATSPNPTYGAVTGADPSDTGAVFYLNIPLPAGNHYIIVQSLDSASLFRNNAVTSSPYPIGSTSLFAWVGNGVGAGGPGIGVAGEYQKYYYFFYTAKFKTGDCAYTGPRTAVTLSTVAAPQITQNGDSLISSATAGNQWYLNGLVISGATDPIYQASKEGNYYTKVTDTTSGCIPTSNTIDYVLSAVDTVASPKGLLVTPNPTTGILNISFTVDVSADLTFELYNVLGQQLYKQVYPSYIGSYSGQLNLGNFADGVYLLKIVHGSNVTVKKILLEH